MPPTLVLIVSIGAGRLMIACDLFEPDDSAGIPRYQPQIFTALPDFANPDSRTTGTAAASAAVRPTCRSAAALPATSERSLSARILNFQRRQVPAGRAPPSTGLRPPSPPEGGEGTC